MHQAFRPWFVNATAVSSHLLAKKDVLFGPSLTHQHEGPQLGGYVVDYEHGLSFATVHGSGHVRQLGLERYRRYGHCGRYGRYRRYGRYGRYTWSQRGLERWS